MKKNMFLKTKDFADLFGVTKHTLFHYDEIGIFKPAYVNEKGYRFYSIYQYDMLDTILDLRRVGMSLTEIKEYLDKRNPDRLIDLYDDELEKIRKSIQNLKLMEKNLTIIRAEVIDALNNNGQILIKNMPQEYLILSQEVKSPSDFSYFKLLGETLKSNRGYEAQSIVGTRLLKSDILNNDYNNHITCYIKTMVNDKKSFIKESGKYLIYYYQGEIFNIGEAYQKIIEYVHQEKLDIDDNFYEELIVGEWATKNNQKMIYKISVRVKE